MSGSIHVISHPLVQHKLTRMRRSETAPAEFRLLMRDAGRLLLYEALRDMPVHDVQIQTPLVQTLAPAVEDANICLIPVLRAGLGLIDGMSELVPAATVAHIGLYRDPKTLEAVEYYFKPPANIATCEVVVVDPMLATGHSAVAAVRRVKECSVRSIKLICLLAAPEGAALIQAEHPDVQVYTASIDTRLNDHAYIVPGLGDAGDRLFGTG